MHARRRGIASSVRPFRTEAPEWSNTDAKEIEAKVVELRKTGMTCAQIGLVLRQRTPGGPQKPHAQSTWHEKTLSKQQARPAQQAPAPADRSKG